MFYIASFSGVHTHLSLRGLWASFPACYDGDWLDLMQILYRQLQLPHMYEYNSSIISRKRHCLFRSSPVSDSYIHSTLSCKMIPEQCVCVCTCAYAHAHARCSFCWQVFIFWGLSQNSMYQWWMLAESIFHLPLTLMDKALGTSMSPRLGVMTTLAFFALRSYCTNHSWAVVTHIKSVQSSWLQIK